MRRPVQTRLRGDLLALLLGAVLGPGPALSQPAGVTGTDIDLDIHGMVYLLDAERNTLRLYDPAGRPAGETGGTGWTEGRFDEPRGVWARNGIDVFVADHGNHRVQRFDRTLSFVSMLYTRDRDPADGGFGYPLDVAVSRQGDLFVCDGENAQVVKVNRFSDVEKTFGGYGAGLGRLEHPRRVEVGPNDVVYVLDRSAIVLFDAFGNFLTRLGKETVGEPIGMVADEMGLLVADSASVLWLDEYNRIRQRFPWSDFVPEGSQVRSFAATAGTIAVLTSSGVFRVRDPRPGDLDKPPKSP